MRAAQIKSIRGAAVRIPGDATVAAGSEANGFIWSSRTSPTRAGTASRVILPDSEEFFAFADFRLYPRQRTLALGEEPVTIGSRAFDILLTLVARAGDVIGVNELMGRAWPGITVEGANLRVQMGALRKALSQCDEARRAIETIPLRGYCFVLPVVHRPRGPPPYVQERLASSRLPMLPNPTVGREDAIAIISGALDERRLVTITGPGGIGKTTVAVATANRHASNFSDEIAFVDLSHTNDGAAAARVIAEAVGVETHRDAVAALCEHLHDRTILLLLDTCEHLVEPLARLAEELLAGCPNVRLLATSREALRATGEWTHRLPSLTFPETDEEIGEVNIAEFSAVTLFIDRIKSSTRYEPEPSDFPVLAQICRRLDGIPLALEFAAARVSDLGLREIAAHLGDRFTILTRSRRTALPRHRTLAATLDWSYGLLSDDERRMLRQLADLGGTFTADPAVAAGLEAGCRQPHETLASLFEKSLLTVDMRGGAAAYRLLDTTRAYMASLEKRDQVSSPPCQSDRM